MAQKSSHADHCRQLAEHAKDVLGACGKDYPPAHVREWTCKHDALPISVDVLGFEDRPFLGATAYTTIGLSGTPLLDAKRKEFPARVELLTMTAKGDDRMVDVLATACFIVMRTQRLIRPGAVIEDCVKEYVPLTTVPHLLFTPPFYWHDREPKLGPVTIGGLKIVWLWAVPISDAEREFLEKHGDEALEEKFAAMEMDQMDLLRASCV